MASLRVTDDRRCFAAAWPADPVTIIVGGMVVVVLYYLYAVLCSVMLVFVGGCSLLSDYFFVVRPLILVLESSLHRMLYFLAHSK